MVLPGGLRKDRLERLSTGYQVPGIKSRDSEEALEESYFAISPFLIFPEAYGDFSVYLKRGRNYLLFMRKGEQFNQKHKAILNENGVQEVYIEASQKGKYHAFLQHNLKKILTDESIPLSVRSHVLHYSATMAMNAVFERSRELLEPSIVAFLTNIVRSSLGFLPGRDVLKSLVSILGHDGAVPSHSVNVFVYAMAILDARGGSDEDKIQFGLGTLLHDIGKSSLPKMVIHKRGKLNSEERALMKLHPQKGVGICSRVPLSQTAIHCILFHHEKGDGSGYPAGLSASSIPMPAKILAVADAYDQLTSEMSSADPLSPNQALSVIRDHFTGFYDTEILGLFNQLLTEAGCIPTNIP